MGNHSEDGGKRRPALVRQDAQLEKFVTAARDLGCDEDEATFDEKLGGIARAKPKQPEEGGTPKDE